MNLDALSDDELYEYTSEQKRNYRLVCWLCAREEYVRLTDTEARAMGRQRCPGCGSRTFLEFDAGRASEFHPRKTVVGRVETATVAESHI